MRDQIKHKNRTPSSRTAITLISPYVTSFSLIFSNVQKEKNRADLPTWVKTLTLPDPDIPDAFTPPQFFIRAPLDPLSGRSEKFGFIELDSERRLSALLRHKQFVEFPTIEVWEEGGFRGVWLDGAGALELQGGQRPAKRRRLDVKKGRAAIAGLLGGYGAMPATRPTWH